GHIKIFGGGGGVILPKEIKDLMKYGIERIYSPDDGRSMGLQGMINDLVQKVDKIYDKKPSVPTGDKLKKLLEKRDVNTISRLISLAENNPKLFKQTFKSA